MRPSLDQPKSREREGYKGDGREKGLFVLRKHQNKERRDWREGESKTGPDEPTVLRKLRNKERRDWQHGESKTGPGEQLKQSSRGKHFYKADVRGGMLSQLKKERFGYSEGENSWLLSQLKREKPGSSN